MTRPGFNQCPFCPQDFMHYHNLSFHISIIHPEKRAGWVNSLDFHMPSAPVEQREKFIKDHGGEVKIPPMQADLGGFK